MLMEEGEDAGVTAARHREGARVRHCHGNLSGVCFVPGDGEQQRRREVDERRARRKLSSLNVGGGGGGGI